MESILVIRSFLILMVMFVFSSCQSDRTNRLLPDSGLEKAARIALNKKNGEITTQDLAQIKEIHSKNCNTVANLAGLQHLVNLEIAAFPCCKITDISPLANLRKLRVLDLNSNKNLIELSPLSKLDNLEELYLSENRIADITPLENLKKLRKLWVDRNNISNISKIGGLVSLEVLIAYWNKIEKLPDFRNLTNLNKVDLHNNNITDNLQLRTFLKVKYVNLQANSIHGLKHFFPIGTIEFLNLSKNPIDCSTMNSIFDSLVLVGILQIDCTK